MGKLRHITRQKSLMSQVNMFSYFSKNFTFFSKRRKSHGLKAEFIVLLNMGMPQSVMAECDPTQGACFVAVRN